MKSLLFTSVLCCVLVYGSAKRCCTPQQWESFNYINEAKTVNGSKSIIQMTESTSVDQDAQLIAATINSTVNDATMPTIKLLQDFMHGKQYTSQSGKCTVGTLPAWTPRCVPDNATLVQSPTYGVGSNHIDVDIYEVQTEDNTLYLSMSRIDCTPVYQSGHGSKDGVSAISTKTYTNITLGIADRHVFDLPPGC